MRSGAVLVMLMGIVGISGCASSRSAQQVDRLRADLALLDQRVTQLERASLQQSAIAPTAEPLGAGSATMSEPTGGPPSAASAPVGKLSKTEVQQALQHAGFYQGPIDGKLGPQTREAIRKFQEANGLVVDGVVGRRTRERLKPYLELSAGGGGTPVAAASPK